MKYNLYLMIFLILNGCSGVMAPVDPIIPSIEYTDRLKKGAADSRGEIHRMGRIDKLPEEQASSLQTIRELNPQNNQQLLNQSADLSSEARAELAPAAYPVAYQPLTKFNHQGPLEFGNPGTTSSLWRESGLQPDFFRDVRAFQPMDLITIIISEAAEGKKTANTETKSESTIEAAIENLLGYEDSLLDSNKDLSLDSLLKASTTNDFKGEGKTDRKDNLKGTISAMVVEVLPSGIVRIEGSRIISVNNEEQVMVISGLARPRDIKSDNTIESSRLANMRIDYFGRGEVADTQRQGWLGRIIRKVWPF